MKKILPLIIFLSTLTGPPAKGQSISSTDTLSVHTMRGTYYSDKFVGRKTSSGEVFRQDRYTAAHRTLKLGTLVLVTNPKNGQQVIVKINDRCPVGNIIDLTRLAARSIGVSSSTVQVQVLPERYHAYWEQQSQLQEVMKKGEFLTYIGQPHANIDTKEKNNTGKPTEKAATPKEPQTTPKPTTTPEKPTIKTPINYENIEHYDIELGIYPSRNTAEKEVCRLPIYYQDRVAYKTRLKSNDVVVVLQIQSQHEQAQKTLQELKNMFPNATLIQKK